MARRVQLFSHDMRSGKPLGFHEYGHDPDYLERYRAHFGSINPWIAGFEKLVPGQAVYGREILPDERLKRTEFYNDWVRPQEDILGSAVLAILEIKGSRVTAIAANVRAADRDTVEPKIRELIQMLAPHLRKSLEISDALGQLTLENRVLRAGMEPDIAAYFVLDPGGRVCHANARGEALLEEGAVVRIGTDGRLRLTETRANGELARALRDRDLQGFNVALPFFTSPSPKSNFMCQTAPLSEADGPHPWIGPVWRQRGRGHAADPVTDRATCLGALASVQPGLTALLRRLDDQQLALGGAARMAQRLLVPV